MQNQGQLTQQQLQQMQMQRQAMANAHNAAAVNVNPGSYNQAPPSAGGYSMNPTGMNQGVAGAPNVSGAGGQGSSTRAYLDQTVIPILMDGESSSLKKKKIGIYSIHTYDILFLYCRMSNTSYTCQQD